MRCVWCHYGQLVALKNFLIRKYLTTHDAGIYVLIKHALLNTPSLISS